MSWTVTIRPLTASNQYLFVSNDNHRNYGQDFDVRTHQSNEQRNNFIIERVQGNIYTIKSAVNPNHYMFCSNDSVRAYNGDFDVRTHPNQYEQRNQWIIESSYNGAFQISSATNPNHKLFCGDDGSNRYGNDFDVRTHIHHEQRNLWYIDGFNPQQGLYPDSQQCVYPNQQQGIFPPTGCIPPQQEVFPPSGCLPPGQTTFPPQYQQQYKVTIRSYTNPNHYLFISNDHHRAYGRDYDVRTHTHKEKRNKWILERVEADIFTIRSKVSKDQYLFCSNDNVRNFGGDFDIRTHSSYEQRNQWRIQLVGNGAYVISSVTNPNHYLFCANDGSNRYGDDFDVRTHPHHEERNKWIIDKFSG